MTFRRKGNDKICCVRLLGRARENEIDPHGEKTAKRTNEATRINKRLRACSWRDKHLSSLDVEGLVTIVGE